MNRILPEDLRGDRTWDKKSLEKLMADIATKYPDRYEDLAQKISDVGRNAAYWQGDTVTLADTRVPFDRDGLFKKMDKEIDMASSIHSGEALEKAKMGIYAKYADQITGETMGAALKSRNGLGNAVLSGARGSSDQLRSMLSTPALYSDYKDRTIPLFIRRSFGEGLRPAEYLAGAFGVRKSVLATKTATALAGDFSKQLISSTTNLIVTEDDCGSSNGIEVETEDADTRGRLLARAYGDIPAGTTVDRRVAAKLKEMGVKTVQARSALTCQSKSGVCAACIGRMADGKMPEIGFAAGTTASQGLSEPITQGALSCLVSGTLVRMADFSVKPIEEIIPGEWVIGADHAAMTFPVQVTGKFDQGIQPAQRYEFKYGGTREVLALEATAIHPILANHKTSNAKSDVRNHDIQELPVGKKCRSLGAVLPVEYSGPPGKDEPLAFIAGLLVGDGCYTHAVHGIHLSCADPTLISYLENHLPPLGLRVTPYKGNAIYWRISMTEQNNTRSSINGQYVNCGAQNPIKKFFVDRGMYGKYAHEKTLPSDIWSWSDKSVLEFLGGLFSADGSVYTTAKGVHGVTIALTSQSAVIEIKKILALRFCIHSTPVHYFPLTGKSGHKRDMWGVSISRHDQIARFRSLVPMQGVKADRLRKLELKPREDTFFRCPRNKIVELGDRQCWDIEVDHPAGLFVLANGLIVHNTKHSAGAFKGSKKVFSGFSVINQISQSPEVFPHRAAVAEVEGKVTKIEDAPQGGKFITVGEQQHYALAGYDPIVKVGDQVEAGDQLSDGIVDVNDVIRLRGLGEGRRYYVNRMRQAMADSGLPNPSRRNLELVARGALDHVTITSDDGAGGYLPDDVVSYNSLSTQYSPPANVQQHAPKDAVGRFLHAPVLHYTIGTKLTPRMAGEIEKAGVKAVTASDDEPPFTPEMVRLRGSQFAGEDWLAKQHSSNLSRNLMLDAERGRDTNVDENTHFVPRLAIGTGFGEKVRTTGKF